MQWLIKNAEEQSEKLQSGLSPENALERFALLLQLIATLLAALRRAVSSSDETPAGGVRTSQTTERLDG